MNIYKIPMTEKIMKQILTEDLHLVEGKDFKHQYYVKTEHPYVADFYVHSHNLVIECDGDYWHSLPNKIFEDRTREREMDSQNISWVRFTETELKKHKLEVINKLSQRLGVV